MEIKIPYMQSQINLNVPEFCKASVMEPVDKPTFVPDYLKDAGTEDEILEAALENPIGSGRLEEIITKNSTVAIIVDDITRPTPTKAILKPILDRLKRIGVNKENIDIVFANGSHRVHTYAEKEALLGREVLSEYKVHEHNAHDEAGLKFFGTTKRGNPVMINRLVADADVKILTGLIKPHCQAAYSGGGKAILPGVSSIETIMNDHNFQAVKCGKLGVIEGNLIREDIEEAAQMIGTCFLINVIIDPDKVIVGAVAGDMIEAHRVGCKVLDSTCRFELEKQIDICIAVCEPPIDINFYQSINGLVSTIKVRNPIIKKGGIVILLAECKEGMGHPVFEKWAGSTPKQILQTLEESKTFEEGQWSIQVMAECLDHAQVMVVSDEKNKLDLEASGMMYKRSVEEALHEAIERIGTSSPEILILPKAPYTILDLKNS